MEIFVWALFALFTFIAVFNLAFIAVGVVACARGVISWRLLVGVALNRGIVFVAWLLVVVSRISGLRLHDAAYLLLLVIPLALLWNRFVVKRDPPASPEADPDPQS